MANLTLAYLRLSSEEQKILGQTEDQQLDQLQRHGFDELFNDTRSGRDEDRPQFLIMVERAKELLSQGHRCTILVVRYDRFARNMAYSLPLIEELETLGAEIKSLDRGRISMKSSTDFMITGQEALLAEYYCRQLSDNVRRGTAYKRSQGRPLSGNPPLGYVWNEQKTGFELDPSSSKAVANWFEMYAKGASVAEVHRQTLRDGYSRSKQGIVYLLRNPVYKGCVWYSPEGLTRKQRRLGMRPKRVIQPGTHPPIVDPDTWELCQRKLSENQAFWGVNFQRPKFLFQRQVRCGRCGKACHIRRVTWRLKTGEQKCYRAFACMNIQCPTKGKRLRIADIEPQIIQAIIGRSISLAEVYASSGDTIVNPTLTAKMIDLEELRTLYQRMQKQSLALAIEELEREIADIQGEDQQLLDNQVEKEKLIRELSDPLFFKEMKEEDRRILYKDLVDMILVDGKEQNVLEVKLRF